MGACFSTSLMVVSDDQKKTGAKVITPNGELHQCPIPCPVSQLLSLSYDDNIFVCNSDCLCYDQPIPAMDAKEYLQPNQIYFVLPIDMLKRTLSASDMAALAVKAATALQNHHTATNSTAITTVTAARRRNTTNKATTRISPLALDQLVETNSNYVDTPSATTTIKRHSSSLKLLRTESVRKMTRYSSKRAKMAVRSFRLRLSTIYEY